MDSEEEVWFFVESLQILVWYHQHRAPIAKILQGEPAPLGMTAESRLVAAAAVDYVRWTESLASAARRLIELPAAASLAGRELWLRGKASPRFRREMRALGWEVYDDLEFSSQEDAS